MRTFRLGCVVGVSARTTVEAETLEEAIEIAAGREVVLGGVGSGAEPTEQWVIEDADGEPQDIHGNGD